MCTKKLIYLATLCTIYQITQTQKTTLSNFSTQPLQQIVNNNSAVTNNAPEPSLQNGSQQPQQVPQNKTVVSSSLNNFTMLQLPQQIAITLTLDSEPTNTPTQSPITLLQSTNSESPYLINQAVEQQACVAPDTLFSIENPIIVALKKALQATMPADATVSLSYEPTFSPVKTSLSEVLSDAMHCESPEKPSLRKLHIHTASRQSFNLIRKRLVINNTIIPLLQTFLMKKNNEHGHNLHDPYLQKLALTVRLVIRDLKNI